MTDTLAVAAAILLVAFDVYLAWLLLGILL